MRDIYTGVPLYAYNDRKQKKKLGILNAIVRLAWKNRVYTSISSEPTANHLLNRSIEAQLALGIILILEIPQTLLTPLLTTVNLLRCLRAVGIVDISAEVIAVSSFMKDIAKLVTQISSLLLQILTGRGVVDHRGGEQVLCAESEGSGVCGNGVDTAGGVAFEHKDGVIEGGGAANGGGVDVPRLLLSGNVILFQVDRETRIGEAKFLAGRGVQGDAGPSSEVFVGSCLRVDGDWTDVMEGLSVNGVDGLDTFLDDVEDDDGVVGVGLGVVHPVGPVDDIGGLGAVLDEVVIGSLIDGLNLVTAESDGLNSPVTVFDIEDLDGDRGDDSEVVAGTLHGPPQLRVGVDGGQSAVGKYDIHRYKLIGDKTVVTLKPAMTTTERRAQITNTLAGSGDSLLSSCP